MAPDVARDATLGIVKISTLVHRSAAVLSLFACVLVGCSSDDDGADPNSSNNGGDAGGGGGGGGGGADGGGADAPLDEIEGIAMPVTLELCGGLTPIVSSSDIEFSWSGAPAETTQYAVRLSKGPAGSDELPSDTIVARLQTETTISVGEKVSGTVYRIDAYALADRTPLCVLSGFNMVTAP